MKHIILPIDFSENAFNACKYALKLLEKERCTFHIVNCYTPMEAYHSIYSATLNVDTSENINAQNSKQGSIEFLKRLKSTLNKPWHFFKIVSSPRLLTSEIKSLVNETKAELVIMGTKGASGLKEIFMGSTTVQVIKSIKNCSILAIPEKFDFIKPIEIGFATDLHRFYTESELQPIIDMAKMFNSKVQIINVTQEPKPLLDIQKFNLKAIQKCLGDIPNSLKSISKENSISKAMELFTRKLDIYLLALFYYPKGYLEKISSEPVVKKIAFHTKVPLLVIPEISATTRSRTDKKLSLTTT